MNLCPNFPCETFPPCACLLSTMRPSLSGAMREDELIHQGSNAKVRERDNPGEFTLREELLYRERYRIEE